MNKAKGVSHNEVELENDKVGCFTSLQFKQSIGLNFETLFKVSVETKLRSLLEDA